MKTAVSTLAISAILALTACNNTNDVPMGNDTSTAISIEARAANILAAMTLEEKIGQILQGDISTVKPKDLKTYNLGSVLNGGNSAPGGGVVAKPEAWVALADKYWLASTDKSDGGVSIPAIWGTDAVHGHNNLQNATIFPHNIGLGAMRNPALIEKIGAVTAKEIRATGIDWTFAPTLAVARDDRWGRAYESYSENPEIVAAYSKSMVEGLQGLETGKDFLIGDHVVATAKHFIGDGGTEFGIDKGDTIGDAEELIKLHGAGYGPAFDAGVQTVMASFSSINGEKMHGSKVLLNNILRGEMGFTGFVVGDWNGHAEIPGCTATDCPASLEAGVDMYMAPDSWKGLYKSLLIQAKSGELSLVRLDEAVTRILEVKIRAGLFEAGLPSKRASTDLSALGAPEHSAIARQAVRESLVLLKNEYSVLPFKPNTNILVTGSGADSMQQQTGGWTLSWQGDSNKNDAFETGETIFSGIKSAISETGGSATHSTDGKYASRPDVAVVVFGEQPYAEYRGDRSDLVFEFNDGENIALVKELKSQGIPVVSVFLTGRPLWVNPLLNASDAFVVAWLPGTEGGGVADVLVGRNDGNPRHDFKGKLSFTWPSDGTGRIINDDDKEGVLYPYGYGLSYKNSGDFKTLSEKSGISNIATSFDGKIVARGDAASPFMLYLGDSSNLNTPMTALKGSSLGGGVSIHGTDFKAQEDSRVITWSGNGKASASIRTRRSIDLTSLGETDNLALKLQWRIDETPEGAIAIGMGCGDGCGAQLDISDLVTDLSEGEWTTSSVQLSCFTGAGLKPDTINTAFQLTSESKATISLHSATIVKSIEKGTCPAKAK